MLLALHLVSFVMESLLEAPTQRPVLAPDTILWNVVAEHWVVFTYKRIWKKKKKESEGMEIILKMFQLF